MVKSYVLRQREARIATAQERFTACLFIIGSCDKAVVWPSYQAKIQRYYFDSTPEKDEPNDHKARMFVRAYLRWLRREYVKKGKQIYCG